MQIRPFLIGITGGSASGKTSVSLKIQQALNLSDCTILSTDYFYKDLTPAQLSDVNNYNFDHPNAFDFEEMHQTLSKLIEGQSMHIPKYDYANFRRSPLTIEAHSTRVMILEGIMAFYDPKIRNLMDLKIFVLTDADECLARRVVRDVEERGRDVNSIIGQYLKFVKPSYDEFIYPLMKQADIIIPRGANNEVALRIIIENLRLKITPN